MEKPRIFYQLITKDGIKSEIRMADNFMPEIKLAVHETLGCGVTEAQPDGCHFNCRSYRMRRHCVVEFVEYEEE